MKYYLSACNQSSIEIVMQVDDYKRSLSLTLLHSQFLTYHTSN